MAATIKAVNHYTTSSWTADTVWGLPATEPAPRGCLLSQVGELLISYNGLRQLMVTPSGLNHAPRRGQRCSVKHTTWQHPIHKEIADIGLLFTKFCKKMCYRSQQHDKNREEKEENRVLPVGLVKYIDFVKLGVKVFQGRNKNEASHVSHISVDDSSSITGAQCTWKERSLKIWYSKWNNHINYSTTTLYLLYSIIDCW